MPCGKIDLLFPVDGGHRGREAGCVGPHSLGQVVPVFLEILLRGGSPYPHQLRKVLRVVVEAACACGGGAGLSEAGPESGFGDVCHASR